MGYRLDAQGWLKGWHLTKNIWKDAAKTLFKVLFIHQPLPLILIYSLK